MKTEQAKPIGTSTLNIECWMLKVLLLPLLLSAASVSAATRYVWQNSPSPAPPYTNWATAAHVIQDAVDAALAGDEIVVTNGTYATGGRAVGTNVLVNRVAVDKPLTLRSVNGPEVTIIQGYQVPGTTNGDGAIRCVYLADGASLSGFTLTNGATRTVGGLEREQSGGGLWCESINAVASNCVVVGNSAGSGGGASEGTLNNCVLTGNSADCGGGANYEHAEQLCAHRQLGSAAAAGRTMSTLNNCTLTGNSADSVGGGAVGGTLNNCIVYFNTARTGANYNDDFDLFRAPMMNHCCTTPMPNNGVGNLTLDPQLASATYLSASSPCRGAGSAAYTTGTDIDGEPWVSPPSIGCDEYHAGAITGPLSVGIVAAYTNVATGYPVGLTALIGGHASVSAWEFGDGVVASNRPYASHAWAVAGDYVVVLRAHNESLPGGVSATLVVHVVEVVHYVAAGKHESGAALHVVGHSGHQHSGRGGRGDGDRGVGSGHQRDLWRRRARW